MASVAVESNVLTAGRDVNFSYNTYEAIQESTETQSSRRLQFSLQLQKDLPKAIVANNIAGVQEILGRIEDASCVNGDGDTTLHIAASKGHSDLVGLLLNRSELYINARNTRGQTPLHLACLAGHTKVVRLLLNSPGIDPNAQSQGGSTPLMLAAQQGHTEAMKLLLERPEVDVNLKNGSGSTALFYAAWKQRAQAIQLLISHSNTDLYVQDVHGWTPYVIACVKRNREIKTILRSSGSFPWFWYEVFRFSLTATTGHGTVKERLDMASGTCDD